jgi:hypothetical protein
MRDWGASRLEDPGDGIRWRQGIVEIVQVRIGFADQVELRVAVPVLELLLPLDSVRWTGIRLGMDECGAVVLLRKSLRVPPLMLSQAAPEVVRDADVEHGFASVREDVDPVLI